MAAKKSNSSKKATKKPSQKNTQTSAKKASSAKVSQPQGMNPQVKAILLFAAGVLFLALLLIRGASLWYMIRSFVFGLFGFCAILLPFVFFYMGIMTAKEKQMSHAGWKVFLAVLTVVMTCTLFYLFGRVDYNSMDYFSALKSAYLDSSADVRVSLCGLVGTLLGYPMTALFTRTPSVVVCFVVLIVSVMILTGISLVDIANVAKKGYDRHVENRAQRRQRREQALEEIADEVEVVDDRYTVPEPASRGADDTRIDIPLDKPRRASKKKSTETLSDDTRDQEIIDIINNANAGVNFEANDEHMSASEVARQISRQKTSRRVSDGAKQPDPGTAEDEPAAPTGRDSDEEPFEKEVKKAAAEHPPAYTYPPIRLLDPPIDSENLSAYQEMQNNATKLIETLGSFGVKASIVDICRGPSVTRYELQPAAGVKISKITNLADDIALNLAANGVRIEAPIPGKAAVGIEVPNKVTSMVTLRELIDTDTFRDSESKLNCVLGRDISGELVTTDLSAMPHLLIAGTTGSGKSVCVNALLMSILFKASPDEVKLLLIDPKLVEFSKYKGIPHLLVPVVSDAKKAAGALNWAVSEMLSRYRIFAEYDCKDINSYNQLIDRNLAYIAEHRELNPPAAESDGNAEEPCLEIDGLKVPTEHMSRIVIAIDELADLMMAAPAEVEEAICRLAQMARAAGMHLIIATQRPSVNVITGVIKANIPSRIALKVSSNIDSRTILDAGGAEKLIGRGDMLYSPVGAPKPIRVQCCFAKDEEIERVTSFIKKKHRADYNQEVEEKIRRIAAEEMNGKGKDSSADNGTAPEVDALMEEAIKVVIEAGQASTSLLQRRMKVGYARAGRMIDDMEQMGIVGPHQGSKPRDVLMTYNEWLERSNLLGSPDTEPYADEEDAPWGS